MSSHQDYLWCDIMDMDGIHLLLSRLLYDLDMISLIDLTLNEFKINGKKIELKLV